MKGKKNQGWYNDDDNFFNSERKVNYENGGREIDNHS